MPRIAFACGGSGGHLYPLITVAREIQALKPGTECYFVSTAGSADEELVTREGFPLRLIPSGKIKGQGLLRTLATLVKMPIAFCRAWSILRKEKPDLVFSAGGYAGAPFLITAAICGIRCAIFEQNRQPGLANRVMAFFCGTIFLNFAASREAFSGRKRLVTVGHPCREAIAAARWPEAELRRLAEVSPFRIFVFGGSQGAVGINRLVVAALPHLQGLDLEIHHQTGKLDFNEVKRGYGVAGFTRADLTEYIHDMGAAYKAAHLVICRAGASSLAELAAAAKAAILIPLVSRDRHQEHNAAEMANLRAALCHLQPELTGEKLAALVKEFYIDRSRIAALSQAMGRLYQPGAARRIAEVCISTISGKFIS